METEALALVHVPAPWLCSALRDHQRLRRIGVRLPR